MNFSINRRAVAAAAAMMLATTGAFAQGFDWRKNDGQTINLLLNNHPWSQAIKANTDALVAMQRMDIKSDLREIARELAKLEIAHESGDWDEELAMYRAELLEEQIALREALASLEDDE